MVPPSTSPSHYTSSTTSIMAAPQHSKTTASSSVNSSTSSSITAKPKPPPNNHIHPRKLRWWMCRRRIHLTGGGVWCVWYSLSVALFTAYLVYRGVTRFLAAASLPWPEDEAPYVALNAYVGLVGAAVVVTPFLLLTSLHKVGNLANDGVQLGRSLSTCSVDPPVLPLPTPGIVRMVWTHGPPTAAFLHLLSAFCLLLPHTLLDAQLLHAGLLPRSEIWTTDLDLFVPHGDRIAVLATLQPPSVPPTASSSTTTATPLLNPVVSVGALDHLQAAAATAGGRYSTRPNTRQKRNSFRLSPVSSLPFNDVLRWKRDASDLRSASLLRVSGHSSSSSATKDYVPSPGSGFEHSQPSSPWNTQSGSYFDQDTYGRDGPQLGYLRNDGSHLNGRQSGSSRNDLTSKGTNFDLASIGQLPVGATIPLANLDASIPSSRRNQKLEFSDTGHVSSNSISNPASKAEARPISNVRYHDTVKVNHDRQPLPLGRGLVWKPVSPEFLNYVLALFLYAVRYPSVFWSSNKVFSVLFSFQMILTGCQTALLTSAFTILYKLHLMGGAEQLYGADELLLSLPAAAALFVLTVLLLTLSSAAVYVHGYHKFVHFVTRSRQRYQITCKEEPVPVGAFSGHIAALVVLVALCLCSGPLVWDLSRVYRGSLDQVVLIAVIGTIVHIFAWIALWLVLTVKTRWSFKLRVTVARACVSSSRSIKLVNDVELLQAEEAEGGVLPHTAPLLVVGSGRAFSVPEVAHKKAIMGIVQKSESALNEGDSAVYWHRPTPPTLSPRPTRAQPGTSKSGQSSSKNSSSCSNTPKKRGSASSPLSESEDDAGDYALLLEEGGIRGGRAQSPHRGGGSKQGTKLARASSASAADTRYVDRRQILAYRRENEQLQRQLQQQHRQDLHQQQEQESCSGGGGEEDSDVMPPLPPPPPGLGGPQHHDGQGPSTPRSARSPDSGLVVHDDPTIHRSDSTSTTTSSTATNHQPDQSTSSTNTATNQSEQSDARNRCGSDDDLSQLPADPSNFPSYPRPLRSQNISGGGSALYNNESTVVIRRQRNLTRELQPADPIYGSRSITSFKEDPIYGGRVSGGALEFLHKEEGVYGSSNNTNNGIGICADDILARAQNNVNSQHYGGSSTSSGSAGYHTASNSSGSNSPVPPPMATTPGLATPPPPMAPLYPHHKPLLTHGIYGHTRIGVNGHQGIYGQTSQSPHPIYGQTAMLHHGIYGRTSQGKLPQAPQIPLPPIPQGSIPPNIHYGRAHDGGDGDFPPPPLSSPSPLSPPPGDLYPGGGSSSCSSNNLPISSSSRYAGGGVGGGGGRVLAVGRSSSLRFAPGTPPRHFTNSLPHVLPRSPHYNTGV